MDGRPWAKGKGKGKGKVSVDNLSGLDGAELYEEDEESGIEHGRSQSVPPELEGSPSKLRKNRELPEDHESYHAKEDPHGIGSAEAGFGGLGKGGRLKPNPTDPTLFMLLMDGQEMTFELSLIPRAEGETKLDHPGSDPETNGEVRGRRNRYGGPGGASGFGRWDEIEAAQLFSQGKVDFYRFLDDDDLVDDPRLVVRWSATEYVFQFFHHHVALIDAVP